jgi:hypothetical protein
MNTPEQVELEIRLDQIFSPVYWRQRQAFYEKQPDATHARFVHYTSADAALKIITSKRMWLRNVTAMSDYSEVRHGYSMISAVFQDLSNRDQFIQAMNAIIPGTAEEAFRLFDNNWNDISLNTYISSVSEHDEGEDNHGRLSMWRAFGGQTARVALVFKVPASLLNAGILNLVFSPVAYLTDTQVRNQFKEVVMNVRDNSDFLRTLDAERLRLQIYNMIVAGVTCLKHEGFREEREWRLIYGPNRWPSEFIDSTTEVVAGIPQVVYRIPLDAGKSSALNDFDFAKVFDRIIIGPTQVPWSMVDAFLRELESVGVPDAIKRIVVSGIPIRT